MERIPPAEESLNALADIRDIRSMMERSTRFLSLSGWSGVWAGVVALISAAVARVLVQPYIDFRVHGGPAAPMPLVTKLMILAVGTFVVAFCGAYYFTWRKAKSSRQKMWTRPARQLMWHIVVPLVAGGVFCIAFLIHEAYAFIAPACLAFYGLALVNGSKYTLGEVRWLGYCELVLGCVALFVPYYGIVFMAAGFGVLHILYGIVMWNKHG